MSMRYSKYLLETVAIAVLASCGIGPSTRALAQSTPPSAGAEILGTNSIVAREPKH
jgi:hypothetical protein